ncbi:ABC transporter substrate-binding protein [Desmonostoc muscorum LEGE 12446]|uniref:ABC transporter substrate-binding protein n=1 Tax=Desmonostoc muscorum LEGE 12446 TaxID=1828758 RepID=A0A8J6ZYM2_DESMC|nr:ABC transporter substrate-binding protein [Desmonostoc muscorum]MCF2146104.1 ABC transporter substrate-binding protein [Desmonostoc muscorum LEGE 12446]
MNNAQRNPYIIGRPIHERSKFFGRESLFHFIEDNLSQGVPVILLHGQRRIGKSSVLKQIPNFVKLDEFVFIEFDLQDKGNLSLSHILYDLAAKIAETINKDGDELILPTKTEFEQELTLFSDDFMPKVYQKIGNKNLVLLLDEFDVVNNDINIGEHGDFFPYLARLINDEKRNLFVIPVIGRYLHDLSNLQRLFKGAPYQEIGLLDNISARRMIANPAERILIYQPEAIQEIIQLSAGHPCFTQVICSTLFQQARKRNIWSIESADVKKVLDKAIEEADSFLQGFWQGLSVEERIIISTVAEAEKIAIEQELRVPQEPLDLLKTNGINQTEQLTQAWERLIDNRYLSGNGRTVTVELIRWWLLKYHLLQNEIQILKTQELQTQENQKIEDIVKNLIEVANFWSEQGKHQLALQHYEQALERDPSNFNIAVSLAKGYLQAKDFEKSLELHKQLLKADSQSYKEGFLDALSEYGHHLIIQGEYALAKEKYNKILEIEPNTRSAIQKILEIENYEKKSIVTTPDTTNSVTKPGEINRRGSTLKTILAVMTVIVMGGVGYGTYRLSSECPPGKQKEFGLLCIEDQSKISNGDRPLFPGIKNSYRDQGIQAFKQEKYEEASNLFGEAVKADRNDPEVLIYYNNARAKQKGNPFTLAVAVPANNDSLAKEILRGVAQAQHEFNENNGLNDRLLEMKIANDAGQPQQATEVAGDLVKDSSILGIIGHYSSESTEAALEEYNKTDIPVISPTSTSTQLLGKKNFFRSLPSDAAGGKKLAEYAFKTLKLRRVVIFSNPKSSYSDSMREEFTKIFENLGGEVVHKPQINLADVSLNMDLEVNKSIYGLKAEAAVLIPDRKHMDIALKIARVNQNVAERFKSQNQNKSAMKLLGGDTLYSNETLRDGTNAVEGLIVVVPWLREVPQAKNFIEKARKLWETGEVSWRTASSYDATQAFIQALSANSARTTVIDKLKNDNFVVNNTNTSGDSLQFNTQGERQTEPILVQIQDGKWVMPPQQ